MHEEHWDKFVIYVNAYYAIQESYDSALRSWERPAPGLATFCRDANPFLWDEPASADEALYESFSTLFDKRFGKLGCTAAQGRDLVLEWLASLEGDTFGTSLVSSFQRTADKIAWAESCDPIERQLRGRAARLERSPQDFPGSIPAPEAASAAEPTSTPAPKTASAAEPTPAPEPEPEPHTPTQAEIDAVIAMLAKGDEGLAAQLRARLDEDPA